MPQTSPMNWMFLSMMIISSNMLVNMSFNKKTSSMIKNNTSIKKKQ